MWLRGVLTFLVVALCTVRGFRLRRGERGKEFGEGMGTGIMKALGSKIISSLPKADLMSVIL